MGIFRKKKEEKKLDEIAEKISVAFERLSKSSEYLVQVTQYLNNNVQALHKTFEEIRKEVENTKNSIDEVGKKFEEFSKKVNKFEPIGLGEVEGLLAEISSKLDDVNSNLKFGSGTFTEPLESLLRDIKDEISNLAYEFRYSRY
ncbi:MAG: hypothetical protein QXE05_03120 [Nitrososphaeria archaeon]